MAHKRTWPPKIRRRRGVEYVRVIHAGRREQVTLGPAGSAEAKEAYARLCARLSAGSSPRPDVPDLPLSEAARRYLAACDGQDERVLARRERAVVGCVKLFGSQDLLSFGPVALKAVRAGWVAEGLSRGYVNSLVGVVGQWIRWCVAEELCPPSQLQALLCVPGLRRNHTEAVERAPVRPAPPEDIEAVLGQLADRPVLRAMVLLQLYTGMRPGEVRMLCPRDVVRPWKTVDGVVCWLAKFDEHKTAWRGQYRWVPIGPRGQAVLMPFMDRPGESYCFSPAESRRLWEAAKRAARKSPVHPSHQARYERERKARILAAERGAPSRRPGDFFTRHAYAHAIAAACRREGIEAFHPHQIRHRVITDVECDSPEGREDSRAVAGHRTPNMTARYAQQVERAAKVIARIG